MNHLLPLKKALALVAQYPLATLILVIATTQAGVVSMARGAYPLPGLAYAGINAASTLLALFIGACAVRWAGARIMNTGEKPATSLAMVARKYVIYAITTLITLGANILSLVGLLALVFIPTEPLFALPGIIFLVPGLLIALLFIFTDQAVMLSDKHFIHALRESAHLVRPRFWYTALRVVTVYALIGVPVFVISKALETFVPNSMAILAVNTLLSATASVMLTYSFTALYIDMKEQSLALTP